MTVWDCADWSDSLIHWDDQPAALQSQTSLIQIHSQLINNWVSQSLRVEWETLTGLDVWQRLVRATDCDCNYSLELMSIYEFEKINSIECESLVSDFVVPSKAAGCEARAANFELVESLWLKWAKTFCPTDLMWSWLVGTITQTDSNPIMWWIQLRECFCLNPIARNAMPCVNVCVCVTSLWSPSGSIWVWINIYIYILYQDCTDNSNDHERHLKRQGLSIPIAANSTLKLWLGCYSVGETSPSHSVVGDDSPRQTAHVNYEALDWYFGN